MNTVVIAVGSNIEPEKNIYIAKKLITDQITLLKSSEFIQTKPVGNTDQDDFINGTFLVECTLNLFELKQFLRKVEDIIGRDRSKNKFGPRTIDLDVVVWNGSIVDDDVYERDFLKRLIIELIPEIKAILEI